MSSAPRAPGQLRQSQVVTTFGPGAMIDLPTRAVLVGGLDHWHGQTKTIREDRLARHVAELLAVDRIDLRSPPVDSNDPTAPSTGITTFVFPAWFVAQYEKEHHGYRSRPLVHWKGLTKGEYFTPEKKQRPVVPVRFVQACPRGHIADIDWYGFVHNDRKDPCRRPLWLDEGGTSGDLAEIFVRCECGARRPLSNAKLPESGVLGRCQGRRPWISADAREECLDEKKGQPTMNRLLIRSASNAYFPQVVSVISIPDADEALRKAVDLVYDDFLQYCEAVEDLRRERKKLKVANALEGWTDDKVWADVERRRSGLKQEERTIKQLEVETLLSSAQELGEDVPDGDFFARALPPEALADWLRPYVDRIVLVHRLREVSAQIGFTRFEPQMPDEEGELDIQVRPAALSLDPTWVPAVENRGEGVFIAFRREAISEWMGRREVRERWLRLDAGWQAWKREKGLPDDLHGMGAPYWMLHTLSHLLLTAVSLECGYSASSIRERVYAGESGYGILLYTGTPDAEGTLGGLVQVGRHIDRHLAAALELGRLCSNDPVCAQHAPQDPHEKRFLHGAACHGCVLVAETSCERRNEWLDRALVVATVEESGAELFEGL